MDVAVEHTGHDGLSGQINGVPLLLRTELGRRPHCLDQTAVYGHIAVLHVALADHINEAEMNECLHADSFFTLNAVNCPRYGGDQRYSPPVHSTVLSMWSAAFPQSAVQKKLM